ncbi:MAG: hypothetical protein U0903_04970 [Planctomycetales bacterium]
MASVLGIWPGMYTDLFVHRTTSMLKATGLLPLTGARRRSRGSTPELDGRDVADVATIVADFHEGVQATITATMRREDADHAADPGTLRLVRVWERRGLEEFTFIPERPNVTMDSKLKEEVIRVGRPSGSTTMRTSRTSSMRCGPGNRNW